MLCSGGCVASGVQWTHWKDSTLNIARNFDRLGKRPKGVSPAQHPKSCFTCFTCFTWAWPHGVESLWDPLRMEMVDGWWLVKITKTWGGECPKGPLSGFSSFLVPWIIESLEVQVEMMVLQVVPQVWAIPKSNQATEAKKRSFKSRYNKLWPLIIGILTIMASNYMVQQIWYIKVKLYYAILQVGTFGALLSYRAIAQNIWPFQRDQTRWKWFWDTCFHGLIRLYVSPQFNLEFKMI